MRLIDADALIEHLRKDPLFCMVERYGIEGVIENAPTIEPSGDLISREKAIKAVEQEYKIDRGHMADDYTYGFNQAIQYVSDIILHDLPSADRSKWITDRKPTKDGTYMVTLDAFGQHRIVDILIYAKPIMPNREVKGVCWYRSDDEWGDIVYADTEILAWMPLPEPYGERKE